MQININRQGSTPLQPQPQNNGAPRSIPVGRSHMIEDDELRFGDAEHIEAEFRARNPHLLPNAPATQGWPGFLAKIGLNSTPNEKELQERQALLSQGVKDSIANAQEIAISRLINRPLKYNDVFFSVCSMKGGVGKTTIVSLIGECLSRTRELGYGADNNRSVSDVTVVDLNPDEGNLVDKFGIKPKVTISDLVANAHAPQSHKYPPSSFLHSVSGSSLRLLSGEFDQSRRESLSIDDVMTVWRELKDVSPITILDNGTGATHEAMLGSLTVSRCVVIVIDNTNDARKFTENILEHIENYSFTIESIGREFYLRTIRSRVVLAINEKVVDYNKLTTGVSSPNFITGEQLKQEFQDKVDKIEIIPFDPLLANSGKIDYDNLQRETKLAVGRLASKILDYATKN